MSELSAYEQRALVELEERKAKSVGRRARRILPDRVRQRANALGERVGSRAAKVPGLSTSQEAAQKVVGAAVGGLQKATSRIGQRTLQRDRIVRAHVARGHAVEKLRDIRDLDLEQVDDVASFGLVNHAYAIASGLEGGTAALVVTGGVLTTVGTNGVAGAPSLGAVAAATAGDAAAVLTMASRVVSHTAAYYGFDTREPAEEAFAMAVIGLGMATTQGAKVAAHRELSQLTMMLARRATWEKLNSSIISKVANRFATEFGKRLTKEKLGQFVPVAGIAIGLGLNYVVMDRVAAAAYWSYRERFLREKAGSFTDLVGTAGEHSSDDDGESLLVTRMIDDLNYLDDPAAGANFGRAITAAFAPFADDIPEFPRSRELPREVELGDGDVD